MKKLESFNGAVTSAIHRLGLDSVKVLNAVNGWVGQVNVGDGKDDKVDVTAKAKLSGKVTSKSGDKRVVTITESEKRVAKRAWCWQGGLYSLSTACDELVDKHGVALEVTELSPEIEKEIDRDSFRVPAMRNEASPLEVPA